MSAATEAKCEDCGEALVVEDGTRWEKATGLRHGAAACVKRLKRDLEIAEALCGEGAKKIEEMRFAGQKRDLRIVALEATLIQIRDKLPRGSDQAHINMVLKERVA